MNNCLACHKELDKGDIKYHLSCLTYFWEDNNPIIQLDYDVSQISDLAKENVAQRIIVTGVQPKLSMGFTKIAAKERLTIVGALKGRYIY